MRREPVGPFPDGGVAASRAGSRRRRGACAALLACAAAFRPAAAQPADPPPAPDAATDDRLTLSPGDLPEPDELMGRVYSTLATRTSRLLSQVPASVTVLSGARLRDLGIRFLADGLRAVPGMEVMRMTSTDVNVSARGFNDDSSSAQGMMGLLDGRQVYNDFYGNVLWDTVPVTLDDVQRVEVVRGPGSFLHGPNAMHGLVNIVTRSPLDFPRDEVDLTTACGTYGSCVDAATVVRREERSGLKVRAAWDDIVAFEPRGDNARDKVFGEARYESLLGERADARLDVTAGFGAQKADLRIPTLAGLSPARLASDVDEGYLQARFDAGPFKARVSWTHFSGDILPDQLYAPFSIRLDSADVDLQHSLFPSDGQTVTVGAGYHYATFATDDSDVSEGRHQTGLAWAFVQDEAELAADALWLTAGVRYDWHSVVGGHASPRLALVWKVEPGAEQYLRASAGWGYRNPSLRELWFAMPLDVPGLPVQPVLRGNPGLDAEQIRSFEVGYAGRWGELRTQTTVEAVAFYNLVDHEVEYRVTDVLPSPPFPPGTPAAMAPFNAAKDDVVGFELEARHAFTEWIQGFAGYAYTVRRRRDTHERIPLAPLHKANAGVRVAPLDDVVVSLWVTFLSETQGFDPAGSNSRVGEPVDGYGLLSGRAAWTFLRGPLLATAFLQGFNLLDRDHRDLYEGDAFGALVLGGLELRW